MKYIVRTATRYAFFACTLAFFSFAKTASSQSDVDSSGIVRALANKWDGENNGKAIAVLSVFVSPQGPLRGSNRSIISRSLPTRFTLLDPPGNSEEHTVKPWMAQIRRFSKQYAIGNIAGGGDSASVDVYITSPLQSGGDELFGLTLIRYTLRRENTTWRIETTQPVVSTTFIQN